MSLFRLWRIYILLIQWVDRANRVDGLKTELKLKWSYHKNSHTYILVQCVSAVNLTPNSTLISCCLGKTAKILGFVAINKVFKNINSFYLITINIAFNMAVAFVMRPKKNSKCPGSCHAKVVKVKWGIRLSTELVPGVITTVNCHLSLAGLLLLEYVSNNFLYKYHFFTAFYQRVSCRNFKNFFSLISMSVCQKYV